MSFTLSRLGVVLLAALAALAASFALAAGAARAHVTVSSTDAAPGGFGKVTFRVPNESDTASTVALRIQIPAETPLASLRAQPLPGWTITMTTTDLEEPVDVHGQEISSYVSVVEFRAEDGGIGPGQFQEFALSGGPFPEAGQMVFATVQTYSDGSESAWIEPTVDGRPEPERPAPVLSLSAGSPETATEETDTAASGHEAAGGDGTDPGAIALLVASVALLLGVSGVVLGWRAGRRTVSS